MAKNHDNGTLKRGVSQDELKINQLSDVHFFDLSSSLPIKEDLDKIMRDLENKDKNGSLVRMIQAFLKKNEYHCTEEDLLNEVERIEKARKARKDAFNYFEKNDETKGLIIETQGGAGHKQAAQRKQFDLTTRSSEEEKFHSNETEIISVLQTPDSKKESWMKLAFIDIGKQVIKDWNEKQKKGEMGSLASLAMFQRQVQLGEYMFGQEAGKKAFTTFTARPNMKEVYDTQNIFTPYIARAVNQYVTIKKDETKCSRYNQRVRFNDFLRKIPLLSMFASDLYLHEITHVPNFKLPYTKVMTDLPTKGEDFFVSLRLMEKSDFENFYLEAPHAAPLTDETYDVENREKLKATLQNLARKYPTREFHTLLHEISQGDKEIVDYQTLYKYLNQENNIKMRELYDIAYYVMQCPNLIDLDPSHFHLTIGPIRPAFVQKYEERIGKKHKNETSIISIEQSKKNRDAQSSTVLELESKIPKEKVEIPRNADVNAIMLGSQASEKTLKYIDEYIENFKKSEKEHYLFVFAGDYSLPIKENDSTKLCLYEKVCQKIIDANLPENVHIIPLENQGEKMIAKTFSIADEVLIRSGGLSSMEVEAVCKEGCRIFVHSETEEDVDSFTSEENFNQACFKKMLPWEEGNGLHIQASRRDCHVKIVNTTSINKIRKRIDQEPKDQNKIEKNELIRLIFKYNENKYSNQFEMIIEFIKKNFTSISEQELRKILNAIDFSKLTTYEKKLIATLKSSFPNSHNFLNNKLLEDALLAEANKFAEEKPKSKTMKALHYQLNLFRQQGEVVDLRVAAVNAVKNYKEKDIEAYKKRILKHCPKEIREEVRAAMDKAPPPPGKSSAP